MSRDSNGPRWGIAEARGRLSELLQTAAREPQHLYNRGRRVGVVVSVEEYEQLQRCKASQRAPTLADAFDELRHICAEEGYELAIPPRTDRANPFSAPDDQE